MINDESLSAGPKAEGNDVNVLIALLGLLSEQNLLVAIGVGSGKSRSTVAAGSTGRWSARARAKDSIARGVKDSAALEKVTQREEDDSKLICP